MINPYLTIAIDGYSGTGKSRITSYVAQKYNLFCLDSGKLYCFITDCIINEIINDSDSDAIVSKLNELEIKKDGEMSIMGKKLKDSMFSEHFVVSYVTHYAQIPMIRTGITQFIREYSKDKSIVVNGRDIGNVVLPDSNLKFLFWLPNCEEESFPNVFYSYHNHENISQGSIERNRIDCANIEKPHELGEHGIVIDRTRISFLQAKEIVTKEIDDWFAHYKQNVSENSVTVEL